jgi:hypothetical protein
MLYVTSCTQEAGRERERESEISSDGGDDSLNYHQLVAILPHF